MPTPTGSSTAIVSDVTTGNINTDALIDGTQWSSTAITYSFPTLTSLWSTSSITGYGSTLGNGEPWSPHYNPLMESDQQAVINALTSWSNVSGLTFTQVAETSTEVGDLRFAYTYTEDAQAWAYMPSTAAWAGDVWFNTLGTSYTNPWSAGSYEYLTAVHEIGHALGLKHPFETSEYNSRVLGIGLDSRSYTVMSYSASLSNESTYFNYEPTTPMILDVAAIQALYGVNTTYNVTDTQYVFSENAFYHQTIWDAGGTDTIVYDSSTGGTINLIAGVSGGSQLGNAIYVQMGGFNLGRVSNIWIADNAIIENATGGSGNDRLIGNAVANVLIGGAGNDTLSGLAGNDTLEGGEGNDTLIGGIGDDLYKVNVTAAGALEDIIVDTSGTDTLQLFGHSTNTTAATIALGAALENLDASQTGTSLLNFVGNAGKNTLIGNDASNRLDGGLGADTLIGGTGDDTYVVDNVGDTVTEQADAGTDTVLSSISHTLGDNVEHLTLTGALAINGTGNALDNTLTGNAAANILDGLAGADTLIGGKGNDTYIVDDEFDVVSETLTAAQGGGIDTVKSSVSYTLATNVDRLTLTGSDNINATGNGLANILTGNSGNNTLEGGAGADTLIGGVGDDRYKVNLIRTVIDGVAYARLEDSITELSGQGSDTLELHSGTLALTRATTLTLASTLEHLDASDTGATLLNLTGNAANNTLTGNSAGNLLNGGLGNDTLIGGAGNDIYVIDSLGDNIVENADEGNDLVRVGIASVGGTYTLGDHVEHGTLVNAVAFELVGNELDNTLTGNAYVNILNGEAGDDLLLGLGGNDQLFGGLGQDVLNGGVGADIMEGGQGNDIYYVDNVGDSVAELEDAGVDTIMSSISYSLVDTDKAGDDGGNIENLTLIGGAAINGIGNDRNNVLIGNVAANILDGGAGADILEGGKGNDTYIVDNAGDVVVETFTAAQGGGIDVVKSSVSFVLGENVDRLVLTGTDHINGTGNSLNNTIVGNSGNNILDGKAGVDTLVGGAGDDIYRVDLTPGGLLQDVITESTGGGRDTIELRGESINTVARTLTLASTIENLDASATGNSKLHLTGNALDNILTGNAADNILNGGAGNDILIGGGGNDILVGGLGADIFQFDTALNASTNVDTVRDFMSGIDVLRVSLDIFDVLSFDSDNLLISDAFIAGAGVSSAQTADQHIIFNSTSGALYYDSDGSGASEAVHFATLNNVSTLLASDITSVV